MTEDTLEKKATSPTETVIDFTTRIDNIEKRMDWMEHVHRNVGDDGNIVHVWSVYKPLLAATFVGLIAGFFLHKFLK